MEALTEETVRRLAAFRGDGAPVTSCYLDVDGRHHARHAGYAGAFDALRRRTEIPARLAADAGPDLERVAKFVRGGIDRSGIRGLAIFACGAHLWEVIRLSEPVRDQLVVQEAPAVGQLEVVLAEHDRLAVLLADRQRARIVVFALGRVVASSEIEEESLRDYDDRGDRPRGDTRHHVEALTAQHARRAAQLAWTVHQDHPFHHLAIGAADELAREIDAGLHPYLRERLAGRVNVPIGASVETVRAAAREVEAAVQRAQQSVLVARLREQSGAGAKAVVGLAPVLGALHERRVDRLVVSDGYSAEGWSCPGCGALSLVGRTCKGCGGEMGEVADVVELAIDRALSSQARVTCCIGDADLDVAGRIGAFLRY